MARTSGFGAPDEGYTVTWNGRKLVQYMSPRIRAAMERVRDSAQTYWRDEEWVPSRHPEMTGDERDQGFFEVTQNDVGSTRLTVGSSAAHAIYEEFGTARRAGHHPIRRTVDVTAPKIAPALRRAFRQ